MIQIFCIDSMRVPWGIVMMMVMVMGSVFLASNAATQNVITDQVAITSKQGKLFGLTSGEGISREFLASGEDVLVIEAKGVTGFVQTSTRLLGFSGRLNRWVDLTLPTGEQIIKWKVTSRMIVVQGRKAAYGFQSDRGRWKRESWGAGESLQDSAVKAHIAVMVTNRRALGFSAFTGGFFPRDLPAGNQIQEIEINDNVVILHLSGFMLVFRSGLAIWAELP
jgi:hypothetical protein